MSRDYRQARGADRRGVSRETKEEMHGESSTVPPWLRGPNLGLLDGLPCVPSCTDPPGSTLDPSTGMSLARMWCVMACQSTTASSSALHRVDRVGGKA